MILNEHDVYILQNEAKSVSHIEGNTAEIGVYKGETTKLIIETLPNRTHYCYDTFSGIVCAGENDNHKDGEFSCSLEEVKRNIGTSAAAAATQIKYCVGLFPDTFTVAVADEKFSFVYSDTATYFGAKHTLSCFVPYMTPGGKIVFYTDHNTQGVEKAINDYLSHTSMRCTQISNFQIIHIV